MQQHTDSSKHTCPWLQRRKNNSLMFQGLHSPCEPHSTSNGHGLHKKYFIFIADKNPNEAPELLRPRFPGVANGMVLSHLESQPRLNEVAIFVLFSKQRHVGYIGYVLGFAQIVCGIFFEREQFNPTFFYQRKGQNVERLYIDKLYRYPSPAQKKPSTVLCLLFSNAFFALLIALA